MTIKKIHPDPPLRKEGIKEKKTIDFSAAPRNDNLLSRLEDAPRENIKDEILKQVQDD